MDQNRTAFDWEKLIEQLEQMTRLAQVRKVEDIFSSINLLKIPRAKACLFAEYARRNSLPLVALKILNSYVRGKESEIFPPTDEELMAFANALNQVECNHEALDLLSRVPDSKHTKVLLFKVLSLHGLWRYRESIPLLKRYIQQPSLTLYEKAIGHVNLLASLIYIFDLEAALVLADRLIIQFRKNEFLLLLANTLELRAQIAIIKKEYSIAIEYLNEAEKLLAAKGGIYLMFVKKWKWIAHSLAELNFDSKEQILFEELISESKNLNLWETIRDLEFFRAILNSDTLKAEQVLCGSPNIYFKKRAHIFLELFKMELPKSKSNVYRYGNQSCQENSIQQEYLMSEEFMNTLGEQSQLLRLFQVLTQDQYRPASLGVIFRFLYPTEVFDPFNGTRRVQNLVAKLNQFFRSHEAPLFVETTNFNYSLQVLKPYKEIKIPNLWIRLTYKSDQIKTAFKGRSFSTADVSAFLGKSKFYARKLIRNLIEKGELRELTSGRTTRFIYNNHWYSRSS